MLRVVFYLLCALSQCALAATLNVKTGDKIAFVGNGFVERDALESYIEMGLILAHPNHELKFRNFGWSGDTVRGESRGYFDVDGYPNLLEKISASKPNAIILAYGSLEARAGAEGLERFKNDYLKLMVDLKTRTQAELILITPFEQRAMGEPYPNPQDYNRDLAGYAEVIRVLAKEQSCQLIDLHQLFKIEQDAWTSNSIHLSAEGYWQVGLVVAKACGWNPVKVEFNLTGESNASNQPQVKDLVWTESGLSFKADDQVLTYPQSPLGQSFRSLRVAKLNHDAIYKLEIDGVFVKEAKGSDWKQGVGFSDPHIENLRDKVKAKNELFFHAWRPANTTYLFFFRKHEQGQNAKEMSQIENIVNEKDVEIAAITKAATQHDYKLSLTRQSESKPVISSLVPADAGKNFVLAPEKEIDTFVLPDDLQVNLFAAEPMVVNPINMNWDKQGRLWVCCSPTYPHIKPGELANDKIVMLEDTDGDGKADKSTIFAEGLLIPSAVLPGNGGVYVANSTELLFFQDLDGDLKADTKRIVFSGFGTEDTHHILHTPRWGQDGLMYINQSIYIHSHVETPYGVSRLMAGGIWRYDTRNEHFDVFARGLVNTWGHQMDEYGQSFATDGAGGEGINYVFPGYAGVTAFGTKHIMRGLNPGQPKHCGLEIVSGTHFPEKYQGLLLANDFRGHRTNSFRITASNSGYESKQMEDIISTQSKTTDRLGEGGGFRPVDVKMGPDGAIYLADWSNIIIQHGEVDFRDERRDRQNGRIWRVTAKGRPLVKQPNIIGAPVSELLKQLSSKERWTVDMCKREIVERPKAESLPALKSWLAALPNSDKGDELRLQGLWLLRGMGEIDQTLLKQLLNSSSGDIRAASLRMLKDVHSKVLNCDELLAKAVHDEHPKVRLEALHVLGERKSLKAAELALQVLDHPMDHVLDYVLTYIIKELEPHWVESATFDGHINRITYAVKASGSTKALGTLLQAQQAGTISADMQVEVLKTVATLGGAAEAKTLFELLLKRQLNESDSAQVIHALCEAALFRNVLPKGDLSAMKVLFDTQNSALLKACAAMVGAYKIVDLENQLIELSQSADVGVALEAIKSLALTYSPKAKKHLESIVTSDATLRMREQALMECINKDPQAAATFTLGYLVKLPPENDGSVIFQSFIRKTHGASELETVLAHQTLPEHVALAGLRQVNISGLTLPTLAQAITKAGNLKPMKQSLSEDEMKAMVAEVQRIGNPQIGESLYRRQSLACMNCHAIGGVGAQIGPDLISIGASAPIDYLIESILQPSVKIKEGYHMTMLSAHDGTMLSGSEVSSNDQSITVRDVSGSLITWPMSKVKSKQVVPMSMMPPGLSASLTKDEFIHLIAFLSNLGKGGDFAFASNAYVRKVQSLNVDDNMRVAFLKGQAEFWDKQADLAWEPSLARVNGFHPLKEGAKFTIMRFECDIQSSGKIGLAPSSTAGLTFKTGNKGGVRFEGNIGYVEMNQGKTYLYVGIDGNFSEREFRLEVKEVEGSPARFKLSSL